MNKLYKDGVRGVWVLTFGSTYDTPGRAELLNMQACTGRHSCPHCFHTWQSGCTLPGYKSKMVYSGCRRFLSPDSPLCGKCFRWKGHVSFLGHTYFFRLCLIFIIIFWIRCTGSKMWNNEASQGYALYKLWRIVCPLPRQKNHFVVTKVYLSAVSGWDSTGSHTHVTWCTTLNVLVKCCLKDL